jgi:hypothetical protein
MLPESLFGWRKQQPAVSAELLQQASWEEADVLVVGDSFSVPRIWQTALTRRGLKVHTETWPRFSGICQDFSTWAEKRGFRGRYVILEVIERNAEGTIAHSRDCSTTAYRPVQESQPAPPEVLPDYTATDHAGSLSVGIRVYLNGLSLQRKRNAKDYGDMIVNGDVHIVHRPDGCTLFSHRQCEDVLFLGEDRVAELGAPVLDNMAEIGTRISKAKLVWAVIPDKSTAYLRVDKHFWDEAERRLQAPNLLSAFRQAISDHVLDLFPGSGTHLSTTGYLLLGETVYQGLQQ